MGTRPEASRVTGIGAVTALGPDAESLWRGAIEGRVAIAPVPWLEARELPSLIAGAVDRRFDPLEPRALALAESAALGAVRDAAWGQAELSDHRTALVVATTKGDIGLLQRVLESRIPSDYLAEFPSFVLARTLAERLQMTGLVETLSLACASGVAAVGQADQLIRAGRADRVLVIGTDALCEFILLGFHALRALDPNGARPFDRSRAGLSVGEAACAVTLEAGSGPARAYVEGYGCTNDANHITGPDRDGAGLSAALNEALSRADRNSHEVGLVECHGTATLFNDAMEDRAYGPICRPRSVPVHSIKGAIGHTMGAAGLINVALAVRGLEEDRCPPTAGTTDLDPEITLNIPIQAPSAVQGDVAIASASGFSGINAAVVLSRTRRPARRPSPRRSDVVMTSAVSLEMNRSSLVSRVGTKVARRLDDFCLAGLALTDATVESAGLDAIDIARCSHALVLGSACGCLDSDHDYYRGLLELGVERANPRVFAYTLPNVVLGEISIAHGWKGRNVMIAAGSASGLFALAEGSALIESGSIDRVIVYAIETASPTVRSLMPNGSPSTPIAVAFLLESPDAASRRGAAVQMTLEPITLGICDVAVTPDARPSLDGTSVRDLVDAFRQARPTSVRVECPTGYRAEAGLTAR